MRNVLLVIFLLCLTESLAISGEAAPKNEFLSGQVWIYDTRPGEEKSRLRIVRVDRVEDMPPVFHISLNHLVLRNPMTDSGSQEYIPHLPVWEESLRQSVSKRVAGRAEVTPEFAEGYDSWIEAVENGSGGAFSLPIKDILDLLEASFEDAKISE